MVRRGGADSGRVGTKEVTTCKRGKMKKARCRGHRAEISLGLCAIVSARATWGREKQPDEIGEIVRRDRPIAVIVGLR